MDTAPPAGGHHHSEDERLLHKLGYAQELFRGMGGFQNFAISFTIISILAGCLTSYVIAYGQGGPVAVTWGWLLVGLMSTIVALSMAEIASAFPTAGGLYYWASKLGSPAWGWFTGWFNLIGQIAVTASIGYGLAIFGTSLLNLLFDYPNSKGYVYLLYAIMLRRRAGAEPDAHHRDRDAEHGLGVLAHGRSRADRAAAVHRSRPPPVGRLRLHGDDQRVRVRQRERELLQRRLLVRVRHRAADGPVHDHGLRRLGAHGRGDAGLLPDGRRGHVHVRRGVGDLRLHPSGRGHVRDPAGVGADRPLHRPEQLGRGDERGLGRVPAPDLLSSRSSSA